MSGVSISAGTLAEIQARGGLLAHKQVTFTGAAGLGAVGTIPLFTVTGQVLVSIFAVCSTTLVGNTATIKVGNATTVTRYLPSVTATNLVAGSTEDITGIVSAGTAISKTPSQVAFDAESIIATVATANITAGVVDYYAFFVPLSDNGMVA